MGQRIRLWIYAIFMCLVEDLIRNTDGYEMLFKQYGFFVAKYKTIIQYEDIEFIPYRLYLDFIAVHIQN